MLLFNLLLSFPEKILSWLLEADTWLFLQINKGFTFPVLDTIFPFVRNANTWIPFYLFLIVLALVNFKEKAWPWILFAVVTVTLTDQVSSSLIKKWIARPRPCQDMQLMSQVRLLVDHCSGGYSFTSSHATNHFGFAMFVYLTTRHLFRKWVRWMFVWALLIGYGQIYVGVHYPLDVLAGSLLGLLIGYITASFFKKQFGLPLAMDTQIKTV